MAWLSPTHLDHVERGSLHGLHGLAAIEHARHLGSAATLATRGLGVMEAGHTAAAVTHVHPLSGAKGGFLKALGTAGKWLHHGLAAVVVGTSTVKGARAVQEGGPAALVRTQGGRGAVLGALGGALSLVPIPPVRLAGGGLLLLSAVNDFGAFRRLDAPGAPTH